MLVAAAVLLVLALGGLQVLIASGRFIALPEGSYLRINHDDYVHVTYTAAELRQDPPEGTVVYLFGGSGAMESFSTEASLAQQISAAAGGEVDVVSLAAHGQSLAQTLAIIDNLPQGDGRDLIAVGLAPMRLTADPAWDARLLEGRPMPLVSPRLASVMAEEGYQDRPLVGVLPGVFDYLSAYVKARGSGGQLWLQPIDYYPHYYGAGPVHTIEQKMREAAHHIAEDEVAYEKYGAYNLRMLAEVTALARERGYAVTWFEQPLNMAAADASGKPTWGGVVPDARRATAALAAELDVPYLRLQAQTGIDNQDFGDIFHLVASGREKWQPVMAEAFGGVLRGAGAAEPAPATPSP